MDEIDRAQLEIEHHLERSIRQHQEQFAPLLEGDDDLLTARLCLACNEEIPIERRRAVPGTFYCVGCQAAFEKRERLY